MHDFLKRSVSSEIKVIVKLSCERETSHRVTSTKKHAEKSLDLKKLNIIKV
jgi:hypothetical protein